MILAAPRTEAEYIELTEYLEDFVVTNSLTKSEEPSQYWIGLSRLESTNKWRWTVSGLTCSIEAFGDNLR